MIIGFKCKQGNVRFENCPCQEPCAPAPYIAILKGQLASFHNPLSVTNCLGCLMKAWISQKYEIFMPVEHAHAMSHRGSIIHKTLESADVPGMKEFEIRYGKITGTVDYLDPAGIMWDWKTCNKIWKERTPYSNHKEQIKGYVWLLKQNGYTVQRAFIFYISYQETYPKEVKLNKGVDEVGVRLVIRAQILDKALQEGWIPFMIEPGYLCDGTARNGKVYCWVKEICDRLRETIKEPIIVKEDK